MTSDVEALRLLYLSVLSRMTGDAQDAAKLLNDLITRVKDLTAKRRPLNAVEISRAFVEPESKPRRGLIGVELTELPALMDISKITGLSPPLVIRIEELKQGGHARSTYKALLKIAEAELKKQGISYLRNRRAVHRWAKTWSNRVSMFNRQRHHAITFVSTGNIESHLSD